MSRTLKEWKVNVVFLPDAPYDEASLPGLRRLSSERMWRGVDGGVAGEFELRGAFPLELGEGIGDGDGAAHAGAGNEADGGSVTRGIDGCEVGAFEA